MTKISISDFSKRDLLLPAILAVFFLVFYLVYEDIKGRTIEEFNNEQLILARTASEGMTSFFDEHQSMMIFLSEFEDIIDFTEEGEEILSQFYEAHKSEIEAITRVDADGIIISTYPYKPSVIGDDISYQEHVKQVIATKKTVISDVFMAAQGYLAIAMHVPVFKEELYVGSLAILIPIDALGKQYLGNIKIRGNGNVWLVSEKGIEIYCPISEHIGTPMLENMRIDISEAKLHEKILSQGSSSVKGFHFNTEDQDEAKRNGQYITFFHTPIGNTYWTILISYQEKEIYAAIARFRNRLIFVFLLLFITIAYFFYSMARVSNVLKADAKRKKAEKTLEKSEDKFRRLFEDHMVVKLLIDPHSGAIIDANKSASTYYGWTREELKRMKISEINIQEANQIRLNIEKVKSQKEVQFEFKHRRKNGTIRDVEVFSSIVEIDGDEHIHSIIYDVTYRKEVEEALIKAKEKAEESDRLKTAFLQNMSHEIRTPMNAIMGFSSLLSDSFENKALLESYTEIIGQRSQDLLVIIDDLLNISKIESGQLTTTIEECNLNDFFEDLNAYFYGYQKRLKKQNIEFKLHAPEDQPLASIYTDKVKLRQIFINLLSNASKYTNVGTIEGGYRIDPEGKIIFYVSDTGIGIPEEKQKLIFERFAQLDQSGSITTSGTGLGLSISKGLVEVLGGEIWLESEVGKGSCFYFSIPFKEVSAINPADTSTSQKSAYNFAGKKILLVEDDSFNTIFIEEILANRGLEILHTASGEEAVQMAISELPDIVLMDIRLPDIDGYEATRLIKQQKPDVCIIAQTAYATQEDKQKALDAGCADYLSKPLDRIVLLEMIKKHLS